MWIFMIDILSYLGGLKNDVTLLYGKAGTGKTTLALQTAVAIAKQKKKVFFLDTEGGFVLERFRQICGEHWLDVLDYVVVMKAKNFLEQTDRVASMFPLIDKFGMIIVDTIGNLYRKEVQQDPLTINRLMDKQLHVLFELSKKVPVLLTNQVYSDMTRQQQVVSVGGNMILKWCQRVVELQKDPRELLMHKPDKKKALFRIVDSGILLS